MSFAAGRRKTYTSTTPSPFFFKGDAMGTKMAGTNGFAFFRCRSQHMYRGGGQNQAEKNSKNAFRPVPVPKSAFPVSGLTEFRGANPVSSSQPIICVCVNANSPSLSQNSPSLPQNSVRLSEFSSPKQYSRNSIPPVS